MDNRTVPCQWEGCLDTVLYTGQGHVPRHCAPHRREHKNTRAREYVKTYNMGIPCIAESCDRMAVSRSRCKMHYKRWARANGKETPPSSAWSDNRRSNYHARRARMNGAHNGDKVLITDLVARDGSNCSWCGHDIDLALEYPDPMSRSIDHVHPLSRGGAHTMDNTQLLHLECNTIKGATVAAST